MTEPTSAEFDQLVSLLDNAELAGPDTMAAVVQQAAEVLGWSARLYLIDYSQRRLVPLPVGDGADMADEDVDATLAGRAFRTVEPVGSEGSAEVQLWVPLLDGAERLGVIDMRFPPGTDSDASELRNQVRRFSALVGHLLAAKNAYGDAFHRARSGGQRSVSSELIWALLPPLTMACPDVVISGLLEPAEQVAGDVFDYALEGDIAHVGMFDATGHDLLSSVIGSLALAAYRNARRRSEPLSSVAARVDSTLLRFAPGTYATGVMGELELATGVFRYANAGHLSPLLLRSGKVVKSLDGGRRILFGFPDRSVEAAEEHLEPGDVIVLYTDGIVEARDATREFFGLERFIDILEHSAADQRHAPETLRRVVHRVLEHQGGLLQDDASVLMVEWRG